MVAEDRALADGAVRLVDEDARNTGADALEVGGEGDGVLAGVGRGEGHGIVGGKDLPPSLAGHHMQIDEVCHRGPPPTCSQQVQRHGFM